MSWEPPADKAALLLNWIRKRSRYVGLGTAPTGRQFTGTLDAVLDHRREPMQAECSSRRSVPNAIISITLPHNHCGTCRHSRPSRHSFGRRYTRHAWALVFSAAFYQLHRDPVDRSGDAEAGTGPKDIQLEPFRLFVQESLQLPPGPDHQVVLFGATFCAARFDAVRTSRKEDIEDIKGSPCHRDLCPPATIASLPPTANPIPFRRRRQ